MNILYIVSASNPFGGTPKKTKDLMNYFGASSSVYFYTNEAVEYTWLFEDTKGGVYRSNHGRNLLGHLFELLKIIDNNNIHVVQAQFPMGELLAFLIKAFRPKVKVIIAFVGPFPPPALKKWLLNFCYAKIDHFVYVSDHVRLEKQKQFPILKKRNGKVIYNGSRVRRPERSLTKHAPSVVKLLDVAGLVDWKNASVLVRAISLLSKKYNDTSIELYIAGDGPEKENLLSLAKYCGVENRINILGYRDDIGALLAECDVFVHPAIAEGFGIAVIEAMLAEKPVILADAGALPELIESGKSGLLVDPHCPESWAKAIASIVRRADFSRGLAMQGRLRAENLFSIDTFTSAYEKLYQSLLNDSD